MSTKEASSKTAAVFGANVSDAERAEALASDAYAKCIKLLALVETIRYPAGRIRPDGKQYEARVTLDGAVKIMKLAGIGRDV